MFCTLFDDSGDPQDDSLPATPNTAKNAGGCRRIKIDVLLQDFERKVANVTKDVLTPTWGAGVFEESLPSTPLVFEASPRCLKRDDRPNPVERSVESPLKPRAPAIATRGRSTQNSRTPKRVASPLLKPKPCVAPGSAASRERSLQRYVVEYLETSAAKVVQRSWRRMLLRTEIARRCAAKKRALPPLEGQANISHQSAKLSIVTRRATKPLVIHLSQCEGVRCDAGGDDGLVDLDAELASSSSCSDLSEEGEVQAPGAFAGVTPKPKAPSRARVRTARRGSEGGGGAKAPHPPATQRPSCVTVARHA